MYNLSNKTHNEQILDSSTDRNFALAGNEAIHGVKILALTIRYEFLSLVLRRENVCYFLLHDSKIPIFKHIIDSNGNVIGQIRNEGCEAHVIMYSDEIKDKYLFYLHRNVLKKTKASNFYMENKSEKFLDYRFDFKEKPELVAGRFKTFFLIKYLKAQLRQEIFEKKQLSFKKEDVKRSSDVAPYPYMTQKLAIILYKIKKWFQK